MPLEVASAGRDGSHKDPLHYCLYGATIGDQSGIIADTLNCDHTIEPEEQRKWLERLAHRYNAHERLLRALKDLLGEIDDLEDIPPEISSATLADARQAVAAAESAP